MELLPYDEFGRLRLAQFVTDPSEIVELEDWEYADCLWVGEAIGFTEWLRYEDETDVLGCISLDLEALPTEIGQNILRRLNLPLIKGMNYERVVALLGEPRNVLIFVNSQKTFEFDIGTVAEYQVDCTIHQDSGLKYITIMAVESSFAP